MNALAIISRDAAQALQVAAKVPQLVRVAELTMSFVRQAAQAG